MFAIIRGIALAAVGAAALAAGSARANDCDQGPGFAVVVQPPVYGYRQPPVYGYRQPPVYGYWPRRAVIDHRWAPGWAPRQWRGWRHERWERRGHEGWGWGHRRWDDNDD